MKRTLWLLSLTVAFAAGALFGDHPAEADRRAPARTSCAAQLADMHDLAVQATEDALAARREAEVARAQAARAQATSARLLAAAVQRATKLAEQLGTPLQEDLR